MRGLSEGVATILGMNDLLLIVLALVAAGLAAALFVLIRNRPAGAPAPVATDTASLEALARLDQAVKGLVEQSNRDRDAVQKALGEGANGIHIKECAVSIKNDGLQRHGAIPLRVNRRSIFTQKSNKPS